MINACFDSENNKLMNLFLVNIHKFLTSSDYKLIKNSISMIIIPSLTEYKIFIGKILNLGYL